ncbi:MAG TPA: type II toxin-antitoxin system HipA family toxin [Iamia sp.]
MTYEPVEVVEVLVWGHRVGAVALNPASGWYAFAYTKDWRDSGVELAPLHMPLREEPYEFPGLQPETFFRLPPLLADALPDTFGNALVDRWMAEQGVPADGITPLDRLAYAADRAMGALTFRPPAREDTGLGPTAIQLADLVVAARLTVKGELSTEETTQEALQQLIQVGTSAGGARAKAVLAFNPTTSQVRSAYAEPAAGFEQWLMKLDGVGDTGMDGHGDGLGASAPYGRIEFAYHLMARASGITMEECRLLAEGPRRHFMTRRFDRRSDGGRHHVISLCALAHLDFNMLRTHSYDQYLQAVRQLGLDDDAIAEAYRRMVFNVVAVNRDDHTKNVGFLRREGRGWELAPAYDVTHAYSPTSRWTSRHLMAVNGKFEDITLDDLRVVGDRNDVPAHQRIVRNVIEVVAEWPDFAQQAEVDDDTTAAIAADIDRFRPR